VPVPLAAIVGEATKGTDAICACVRDGVLLSVWHRCRQADTILGAD
jgi:hypothetical protein